jgi:hypothetical protein
MKKTLAAIIGLGFIFRLLFLGSRQLGVDELLQALLLRASSLTDFGSRLRHAILFASPVDLLAQKGTAMILGDFGWGLRLPAAVFGTLSIWAFYRVARMLFNERAALYSTALFAVFPLQYHYSQEARSYSLLVLLTLVAYELLLRIDRSREAQVRDWLLLGVVLTVMLYTNFLGLAILVAQGLSMVLVRNAAEDGQAPAESTGGSGWNPVFAYAFLAAVSLVVFSPWLRFIWSYGPGSGMASPRLILRMVKELGDNSYLMSGLLLAGVMTGCRAMFQHGKKRTLIWLACWFAVTTVAVLALQAVTRHPLVIADLLPATPPLVLLAGYGLTHVGERLTILPEIPYQLSAPAFVYAGVMVLASVWIAQSHWRREPVDWAGTASFLQGTAREGDAIAMPKIYPLIEYYAPGLSEFRSSELDSGPGSLSTGRNQRRVVVCSDGMHPDPCAGFRQKAQKDPAWRKLELRGVTAFVRQR